MMLHARKLTPERTAQAFPLVQLVYPELSYDSWQRYADYRISGGGGGDGDGGRDQGGMLLIEDASGHIAGLLGYLIDQSLLCGRVLIVKDLVTLALFEHQRRQTLSVMVDALDRLASEHDCAAIHTMAAPLGSCSETIGAMADLFLKAGHRNEPWGFSKLTAPARG